MPDFKINAVDGKEGKRPVFLDLILGCDAEKSIKKLILKIFENVIR